MNILFLILGLIFGAAISFLFAKSKFYSSNKVLEEKAKLFEQEKNKIAEELKIERDNVLQLNKELSKKETEHKNISEKLSEQEKQLIDIHKQFKDEFENLANKIFEEKSSKFTEQNKNNLSSLLNPLGEKIKNFESRINEVYSSDTKDRAALKEQLRQLSELNRQITKDADNLTKALKGESKTQGTWGEFILEKILEKSGLVRGEQFEVQKSYSAEGNKRLQPDVVVYLPEGKHIIVDSKVSLTAYERYSSTEDEIEKKEYLKEHLRSIKSHVKELSEKNYQNIYQIKSLDFVLMFIPIEPALAAIFQTDHDLYYDAFEKNILIVNPSTLLATLRTIESIWKQEKQNKNAQEIARQSGALYDKFEGLVKDLIEVGKKMDDSKFKYEEAMKKLSSGKGNLVRRVEKLKELGANTTKILPQKLLDVSEDN